MTVPPPVDPGATPPAARALAPDLARGFMLLLIALANVHFWSYGHPVGVRGYPRDLTAADQAVTMVQMLLVDGRAYPLFGFLFGYGVVQLARRRGEVGMPADAAVRLVRRRAWWMLLIGFVHGLLLWSGDIVGAYGVIALVLAGMLVRGTERGMLATVAVGLLLMSLFAAASGLAALGPEMTAMLPSMAEADPLAATPARIAEWIGLCVVQVFSVSAAVVLGALAARRRLLDEPERHRRLLVRVAIAGLAIAVLGGLPLALMAAQTWGSPPLAALLLAGFLHGLSGYAGGLGYAALFGLLAVRFARSTGPVTAAVQACGQRSLSCYLAQSVAFAALLPAWTFGLGGAAHVWQTALCAVGVWLLILLVAAVSARAGYRGPAELLLRRLTYGKPRTAQPAGR